MIKQTIPFDSKTLKEETDFREKRIREIFEVKVKSTGTTAERISRLILPSQTTINYGREEYLIRGEGYKRFIQV